MAEAEYGSRIEIPKRIKYHIGRLEALSIRTGLVWNSVPGGCERRVMVKLINAWMRASVGGAYSRKGFRVCNTQEYMGSFTSA